MDANYISRPAILIKQPLGHFFVFSLDAETLNSITYSQPAQVRAKLGQDNSENAKGYSIFGAQRKESKLRLDELSKFILATDATFPNSIILAANYDDEGILITEELEEISGPSRRWTYLEEGGNFTIKIPRAGRSASIIDGQHRLHAFTLLPQDSPRRKMELLCVVFLELPAPYQAYVFATINFNQKKVDRGLAYELFGFSADPEDSAFWPPETLAVYFARILNTDPDSPLYRCIAPVADSAELFAHDDEFLLDETRVIIRVSMATIVDGILSLISKKPKEDRYQIKSFENDQANRSVLKPSDELPLRSFYISNNDKAIFDIVINFFTALKNTVWVNAQPNSYLLKTVGIQAAFDVLKITLRNRDISLSNYSIPSLMEYLGPCVEVAKNDNKYEASGIGRLGIKNDLLDAISHHNKLPLPLS